jgi:hypothetical protein
MARMNWSRFSRNNYERGAKRPNYNIYDASDERFSTVTRKQKEIMYRIIESNRSTNWDEKFCKSCLIATNLSIKQKNLLNKIYLRVLCNHKQ